MMRGRALDLGFAVLVANLAAALRFHPAGPLLFAAMVVALVAIVPVFVRRGRPLVERHGFAIASEAVVLACLMIGIFKMVRW